MCYQGVTMLILSEGMISKVLKQHVYNPSFMAGNSDICGSP